MPIIWWTLGTLGSMFAGWFASDIYQTTAQNEQLGTQAQIAAAIGAMPAAANKQRRMWWLYLVVGILIFIILWLLRKFGVLRKLKTI
jgi:hypothetical protein